MRKPTMNKFSTTVEEREKQCHVVGGDKVLEFFNIEVGKIKRPKVRKTLK
jgi:hypothetical protein